jgi:hypothetical protein
MSQATTDDRGAAAIEEADDAIAPIEHDVAALNNLMDALEIRRRSVQERVIDAFGRVGCRRNRVL